VARNKTLE